MKHLSWPDALAICAGCYYLVGVVWGIILRDMNRNRIEGEIAKEWIRQEKEKP